MATPHTNPIYGPNRLKLGIFNLNCNGSLTISLAPERWNADWDDIVKVALLADEAGIEFILPVAGLAGAAVVFLNYLNELPYFVQEVLPRMARAGLRDG
jgi:hypothetical protein